MFSCLAPLLVGVMLTTTPQTETLPKYTHPLLNRLLKNTPYFTFINAYPHNTPIPEDILDKERAVFSTVRSLSLLLLSLTAETNTVRTGQEHRPPNSSY